MRKSIRFAAVLHAAVVGFLAFSDARAGTYSIVDLGETTTQQGEAIAAGVSNGHQAGAITLSNGQTHAMLWSGAAASAVDLNPAGFAFSEANNLDGNTQVGDGQIGGSMHALLWNGSAGSAVDLNPVGFSESIAYSASGGYQAGWAISTSGVQHALLWHGSSSSYVDLDPTGTGSSRAFVIFGGQVGGDGNNFSADAHALLWTSMSAASVVDLNPAGFSGSSILGMDGAEQVGRANVTFGGFPRAMLWSGSAESGVDLTPPNYQSATALGVANGYQVGFGVMNDDNSTMSTALLWNGTAASAVNLQQFLSSNFVTSEAWGIDPNGDIVGVAVDSDGLQHAIEWVPVPEPAGLSLIFFGVTGLMMRRRNIICE